MTPKERAAMQQALEALEVYEIKLNSRLCNEAITALREALANTRSSIRSTSEYSEQAEQGPVARVPAHPEQGLEWLKPPPVWGTLLYAAPVQQAEQGPVAYISRGGLEELKAEGRTEIFAERDYECAETLPLYAAPVRTKDLTDDEIDKAFWDAGGTDLDGCRAVIAADREKNK